MLKPKPNLRKFAAFVIIFALVLNIVPQFSVFADDTACDFTVTPTNSADTVTEGVDYSFSNGILTLSTLTPVTVGMRSGAAKTSNAIVVDTAKGMSQVTFNSVNIETAQKKAIEIKNNNSAKFTFCGTNTVSVPSISNAAGIEMNKSSLQITGDSSAVLNIPNTYYGINAPYSSADTNKPLEINGNMTLNITDCTKYAIYNQSSSVLISGAPVINTKSDGYAIYGRGINISGGKINAESVTGFAITFNENSMKVSGNSEINITDAQKGIQSSKSQLTVTDNAKIKITIAADGAAAAASKYLGPAINVKGLTAEKKAVLDLFVTETAVTAGESPKITDDAKLLIRIARIRDGIYPNALSFSGTFTVSDNANVDIEIKEGENLISENIKGFNCFNGTVDVKGSASVTVTNAQNAFYVKNLNLSDSASVKVVNDKDAAVTADLTTVANSARLELSSAKKALKKYSVTPASGKAYMVKSGASEEEADTVYYADTAEVTAGSSVKYFLAEPTNAIPVSVTPHDDEVTYTETPYDLSRLFTVGSGAGAASYSIVRESSTGEGSISGNILTVSKSGIFRIKINTAATATALPAEAEATLTVNKAAAQVTFPAASPVTYGTLLADVPLTGGSTEGSFAWKDGTVMPGVSNAGYTLVFTPPSDAYNYDYSAVDLEKTVPVQVNPLPVNITWSLPQNAAFDGTDKQVFPTLSNKQGSDEVNLTSDGVLTAKDAGSYTASVTAVDNENYTIEGGTNLTLNWSVLKGTNKFTVPLSIENRTFGEEPVPPTAQAAFGTPEFTYSTSENGTYTSDVPTEAGTYYVKAAVAATQNYDEISSVKEFVIYPKTISPEVALKVPVKRAEPQTSIETEEYTAEVKWTPEPSGTFGYRTVYTATVTITPKPNYTTKGIAENGYIFDGATAVSNGADQNTVTVTYPATGRKSSSGTLTYTVKFESNGGSSVSAIVATAGTPIKEPAEPVKKGYTFGGWYTDKNLINAYNFSARVIGNTTLYAKWTAADDTKDDNKDDNNDKPSKPETPKNPFNDVKSSDWYYDDVIYTYEKGLFAGTSNNTFSPNTCITRAMFITVLYRAEGEPDVNIKTSFEDVEDGAYYAKAVEWGVKNNIIKGISQTEFAPDRNSTREQTAALLYRYASYKGYDISAADDTNILSFEDFGDISEYAVSAVQYTVGSELMRGKSETTFNPKDNTTRAETAAVLHRFFKN